MIVKYKVWEAAFRKRTDEGMDAIVAWHETNATHEPLPKARIRKDG